MESRKEEGAGNDWHLGNCLVRTESNRGASNSTSSFLLAVCAYARKSVAKICSMIIYNGCALVVPSRMHAAVTGLSKGCARRVRVFELAVTLHYTARKVGVIN